MSTSGDTVEVYRDVSGEWRWRRIAANHRIIATSGEGYVSLDHAIEMAERVNGIGPIMGEGDE